MQSLSLLKTTFRKTFSLLDKKQKQNFFLTILLICLGSALDVFGIAFLLPVILAALDNTLITKNEFLNFLFTSGNFENESNFLLVLVISLLALFILKNLLSVALNFFHAGYSFDIATGLAKQQVNYYLYEDYSSHKTQNSSVSLHNIINIPIYFSFYLFLPTLYLISEIIVVFLILSGIAIYNIQIFAFLLAVLVPAILLIFALTRKKITQLAEERNEINPKCTSQITETLLNYIDINLSGTQEHFIENYLKNQRKLNENYKIQYGINQIPTKALEVMAILGMALIFVFSLIFAEDKTKLVVFLSLFAAAAFRLLPSMNRILLALMNIKAYNYTLDILSSKSNRKAPGTPMEFNKSIAFEKVSFSFPGAKFNVLENISIKVQKGEKIGFAGESGVGKTTLMKLLLRFYKETSGRILVDGVPLTEEYTENWRRKFGYVSQDLFLLDATIKENIAFGIPYDEIDEEKLKRAIKNSSLEKLINSLPDGADTRSGELGNKLSMGQKQRISIARALYKDAEILIFDEATSSLDAQTEAEITEAIGNIPDNTMTIFIVAHRPSMLQICDRVYELRQGQISSSNP